MSYIVWRKSILPHLSILQPPTSANQQEKKYPGYKIVDHGGLGQPKFIKGLFYRTILLLLFSMVIIIFILESKNNNKGYRIFPMIWRLFFFKLTLSFFNFALGGLSHWRKDVFYLVRVFFQFWRWNYY
ncbi:hypothetical protein BDC45DRAFT_300657 [Circinella umbellata]|nr:hypothetical protein BDC45DRAFT_300657 [Circinella umbellata]